MFPASHPPGLLPCVWQTLVIVQYSYSPSRVLAEHMANQQKTPFPRLPYSQISKLYASVVCMALLDLASKWNVLPPVPLLFAVVWHASVMADANARDPDT